MISASRAKKRKIVYHNECDLRKSVTTSFIDEIFTELDMFIRSITDPNYKEHFTNEFDTMIRRLGDATSIGAIVDSCTDFEICYTTGAEYSGLRCKPCTNAGENAGYFHFTHLDGSEKLRGLKSSMKSHLLCHTHGIHSKVSSSNDKTTASKAYVCKKVEWLKEHIESYLIKTDSIPAKEPKQANPVKNATSIEDILKNFPDYEPIYEIGSEDAPRKISGIKCKACFNPSTKTNKGFFQVSQDFGHFKEALGKHLVCKTHLTAVGKTNSIVTHQSKKKYEEDVAFVNNIEFTVGDINHSNKFVDNLFPELYYVLQNQTMTFLNAPVASFLDPSPFVVFADKITPHGTTQQVIGVILYKEGKNVPILLDVLPVKHECQNGAALAQDIVQTLLKFYTPMAAKKYYVGSSFDGQYIALGVPRQILLLLGYEIDSGMSNELLAQTTFQSVSWDPAHILELSCGDVIKSKCHEWVEKVEQSIVTINKANSHGKQYNRLVDFSKRLGIKLMRPGTFSETRFCSYKNDVLKRFLNNFVALFVKLSEDGDCDLNMINNCEFCLRLCGLSDIFKLIGSTSAKVQSSEIFPWMTDTYIEDCISGLNSIARSLQKLPYDGNNELLHNFNNGLKEISTEGSFKGKGVYYQKLANNMTRSKVYNDSQDVSFTSVINRVILEVGNYASALAQSFQRRYLKSHSQKSVVACRESFSFDKIYSRPNNVMPIEFVDYCLLAKSCGFLETDVLQDTLNTQYIKFTQKVHSLYNEYAAVNGLRVAEDRMFWEVMNSENMAETCTHVFNLLVSALVRNKSECCAESIGSKIKIHLDKRVRLTDEHFGQEIFLSFNGPRPNRDSNGLVRAAMNRLFGGKRWHVFRTSNPSDLKTYETSKVVDKIHSCSGKVAVPDV